jgi:DNA-binding LytR/AlgR family response regulator
MAGGGRNAGIRMSLRVVVVEDEPLVARRLVRMTREALGGKDAQIEYASGLEEATRMLGRSTDAVVLLDLNLGGADGFELLRRAIAEPFQVIVVSASVDRAVEAFELGVLDFVPKPFTAERLEKALQRATSGRREDGVPSRFLAATLAGKIELIPIESVLAVHGADDYSEVETLGGQRHLHRKTLATLEQLLPPDFVRVHRSHIANLRHATRLVTDEAGRRQLMMSNGSTLPVSRTLVHQVEARLL